MEIVLLDKSPDFLKKIWVAARTCYSSASPVEMVKESPSRDEMLRIAARIISSKHLSVLEHCHMTFAVKDVSRTLLAQYSRHRIGISLSVQSQRYVSEKSAKNPEGIFDFIIPPEIEYSEQAKEVFLQAMEHAQGFYDSLKEFGIKNEDARFVLPGAAGTNFVTSLNLRSFLDIYEKRVLVKGAQWEIKKMISDMARVILAEEPWLSDYLNIE